MIMENCDDSESMRQMAMNKTVGDHDGDPVELPRWFDTFLQNVCELPDRNSPADEPQAIIKTIEELRNCAVNAIEFSGAIKRCQCVRRLPWRRAKTGQVLGACLFP